VVFGGTFDPVHIGHLRMATELRCAVGVDVVHLMPCFQAVHKEVSATSADRLNMLALSIDGDSGLAIDKREIRRNKPSFTYDSLRELRKEISTSPMLLVMGSDSVQNLPSWRHADAFSALTNLLVIRRPGVENQDGCFIKKTLGLLGFSKAGKLRDLKKTESGLYSELDLSALDISSTEIRSLTQARKSIRYLVKDAVRQYICDNELYRM